LNVHVLRRIDHHAAECNEDSAHDRIWDTENWLHWTGDLDHPNDNRDNCKAHNESDLELDSGIQDQESPEQWDISAIPIVPGMILPTGRSHNQAEMVLITVSTMETRRNKGHKAK